MLHGDGEPLLIEYIDKRYHLCYVVMKSDIADCPAFRGILEHGKYYDFETPYGYGGPLSEGVVSRETKIRLIEELTEYCRETNVISQFIRFHPLLLNHEILPDIFQPRYLRDTIYIDTRSEEKIMENMHSKNRNMVRKAQKNGVYIEYRPIEEFSDFVSMYEETMKRDQADEYYYFHEEYFEAQVALREHACIFYAMLDGKPIAGSIMYYNDKFMHYHLSGSYAEYRNIAPTNLLLYEAARWASERGISQFHLGGGMAPDDGLFKFKKQFNKNGRLPFVVGKTVFDKKAYDRLMNLRSQFDTSFDPNNNRMIQYRA